MRLLVCLVVLAAVSAHAQDKPEEVLSAVVGIEAKIQPGARSSATLGDRRTGNGVLIRDEYVLTIGYLVVEAESIQVTGAAGKVMPATLAGYDHATGFGLLKLTGSLGGKPMPLGDSSRLREREPVLVAGAAGPGDVAVVHVASRRPFAGGWEYLLDSAIFTYPAVRGWSGAPLIGAKGELLGIGSLIVPDAGGPGTESPGNMFVPIDLLRPILEDLIAKGSRSQPQRPWLGVNTDEIRGHLFVSRVSPESPAEAAGLKAGDIVLSVGGAEVRTLEEFYRRIWARGAAGVDVPLKVLQGAQLRDVSVHSIDRSAYFKPARGL
jgi:S1-C subfamily serine protease